MVLKLLVMDLNLKEGDLYNLQERITIRPSQNLLEKIV